MKADATKARIYRPARTATQAGCAGTRKWVLEFEPASPRTRDPLMGWTSSADTRQQLRLTFDNLDEAVNYAEREGLAYAVELPRRARRRSKIYADNFRYMRPH
ncbi:MAG: ETC complex I subunit [Alphaproteobacteria bacterium]